MREWISVCALSLGAILSFPASLMSDPAPRTKGPPPLKLLPLDRLPTANPLPASDEAEEAIRHFKIPEGFKISLFAAEPMLANPVAFTFDEKGTAYIAETYRYRSSVLDIRDYMPMLEQELAARTVEDRAQLILDQFGVEGEKELSIETEVVRRIVDSNGDGVADSSTAFATGFNSPLDGIASGVLARDGKVWFTNIPHLWLLDGPDARGISKGRTSLSYGYGVRFNFTGHDLHGLVMGPDGKLYFSIGDRGTHAKAKDGSVVDAPDMGAVFRCWPDGTELEIVHSGLRNPQELAFDDFGNLFTGDNDSDQGDVERFVQVVEGGDSGWRVGYQFNPLGNAGPWNFEQMWKPRHEGQPAYILPPIVNTADGPSGLTHYPGTGLPSSYRDVFFMCHFKGSYTTSGIYLYALDPQGASFTMRRQELFLGGTLPTDVDFGPDGRLYFSDWGNGWAKSRKGRLYALTNEATAHDPLIRETQRLIADGMKGRSDAELFALIGHPDQRVRLEAQYALAAKGASALPLLTQIASHHYNQLARIHGIWALGQVGRKQPEAYRVVLPLLSDADPEVRAQSAKVLGDGRVAVAFEPLLTALKDSSGRVRFFAAQSLGKLGRAEAAPALIEVARENADQDLYLRHAVVMGLVGGKNPRAMESAAADSSRAVRLAVLLAYRRLNSPEIAGFLTDPDPFIVAEAARAINDAPVVSAQTALADLLPMMPMNVDKGLGLRILNAHFRNGGPENAAALAAFAARTDAPDDLRIEALLHLSDWAHPPARDRIVGVFRPLPARDASPAVKSLEPFAARLLADGHADVQLAAIRAIEALNLRSAGDALAALVLREDASSDARAAALKPLSEWHHPRLADAVKAAGLAKDASLRAAAQGYYSIISAAEAVPLLLHALDSGTLVEKQSAITNLAKLDDPRVDKVLGDYLSRIDTDKKLAGLQVEILDAVDARNNPALKQAAEKRAARLASAPVEEKYSYAMVGGKRAEGRHLFFEHPVLACVRCHRIRAKGGEAGPALDTIGRDKSRAYILESIVAPNASIAAGFDSVAFTLKDGSVKVGSIASEDDRTYTLRTATDEDLVVIKKNNIVKRETAPSSMPEIFGLILKRGELRDLVEFVSSLGTGGSRNEEPAVQTSH
ncbi:MAG: HEAT repeat domain-containing protein [Opitutaceae bacterium]|nr:HEAT repeat domain-containing protein [Opitutaceae bacterium]